MNKNQAIIAANRFGMGTKGNEIHEAGTDPQGWLLNQLTPVTFNSSLPQSNEVIAQHALFRAMKKKQAVDQNSEKRMHPPGRQSYLQLCADNLTRSISSNHSFTWRLLDFFSNHFSVSAQGGLMTPLAPTLEREAISPNLFGSFADLLIAVEQHPAMLIYLDNDKSIGPDSRAARYLARKAKPPRGINENLAREILELHTMGADGGYTLKDIQELARAITGWSVANPDRDQEHLEKRGFLFRSNTHQPGQRTVLGKTYLQAGIGQGESILEDIAVHPSTARYLSFKLARHFISDTPPPELVNALEKRWLETGGQLKEVFTTLVSHDSSWRQEQQKLKTPREYLISVCRATSNLNDTSLPKPQKTRLERMLVNTLTTMGQRPFGAGSPAGYKDTANAWDGSDALLTRIDWINRWVERIPQTPEPLVLADRTLNWLLTQPSRQVVSRAESRRQGVALFLLSPEFMRR